MINAPILSTPPSALAVLPMCYLQIIPPHDTGIAAAIEAQSELWKLPKDAASSPLVTNPLRMVTQRYYYSLQQELSFRSRQDNPKAAPVVYTPLHGVGLPWLQKVLWRPFLHKACHLLLCSHLLPTASSASSQDHSFIWLLSGCLSFSFLVISLHSFCLVHSSSHKADVAALSGPHQHTHHPCSILCKRRTWRQISYLAAGSLLTEWH